VNPVVTGQAICVLPGSGDERGLHASRGAGTVTPSGRTRINGGRVSTPAAKLTTATVPATPARPRFLNHVLASAGLIVHRHCASGAAIGSNGPCRDRQEKEPNAASSPGSPLIRVHPVEYIWKAA
jgi:hypothetical protein